MKTTKAVSIITIIAVQAFVSVPGFASGSAEAVGGGHFAGIGIAAIEMLAVLVFMAVMLKRSDAEVKTLRERASEKNKFVPPEPEFPNITTVASNMASEGDVVSTPFDNDIDYGEQGEPITEKPVGEVYSPFTGTDHTDYEGGIRISDIAAEKGVYMGFEPGDDTDYDDEAAPIDTIFPDGKKGYVPTDDNNNDNKTECATIFDSVEGQAQVPLIKGGSGLKTTAPSIFDTVENNNSRRDKNGS